MEKIKNLKKAVGNFKRYNKGGCYAPHYAILYYNKETNELWCNEYIDFGHSAYTNYNDKNIVNLSYLMQGEEIDITMKNVKNFIEKMQQGEQK